MRELKLLVTLVAMAIVAVVYIEFVPKEEDPDSVPDWPVTLEFVRDVTVNDGTHVRPGTTFRKVWRLRNNDGVDALSRELKCRHEQLGFVSPIVIEVPAVKPGATIDVEAIITVPSEALEGHYTVTWSSDYNTGPYISGITCDIVVDKQAPDLLPEALVEAVPQSELPKPDASNADSPVLSHDGAGGRTLNSIVNVNNQHQLIFFVVGLVIQLTKILYEFSWISHEKNSRSRSQRKNSFFAGGLQCTNEGADDCR